MYGMGQEAAAAAGYENVLESWAIYDTILISDLFAKPFGKYAGLGWFPNYVSMAAAQEWPFFNVRNSSEVGLAYTNVESKDQTQYVFHIESIGVQLYAPKGTFVSEQIGAQDNYTDVIWMGEMPLHLGMFLEVREDQKLKHTVDLAPAGAGISGIVGAFGAPGTFNAATNGLPYLKNRFKFPEKISIPRSCNMRVVIKPSTIAQFYLLNMPGPFFYELGGSGEPVQVGAIAAIRVSLFGKREVQQRGALHY